MNAELRLALDRSSVRSKDDDGNLHVSSAHISKANVCPYLGREIPGAEEMGLDPERTYMLLRHPDELAKAAPTLNNKQLLIKHDPVSPADPKKDLTVGSTGTDAKWNPPYLDNSLVVWDAKAIEGIESERQKELSAGYYYRCDLTPGIYEGTKYDGVMRDIRFNHVALVVEGRAGDDVVVGDSMENVNMSKKTMSRKAALAQGAIAVVLAPRLAQDAKLNLGETLAGVTHANWKTSKAKILGHLKGLPAKTFKDKTAMDAAVEETSKALDALDAEDPDKNLEGTLFEGGTSIGHDSPRDAIEAMLKGKVSDEDLAKVLRMVDGEGEDESELDTDIKLDKELVPLLRQLIAKLGGDPGTGAQDTEEEGSDEEIGKGAPIRVEGKPGANLETPRNQAAAMDKALRLAEDRAVRRVEALHEARKLVKPLIGKVACDSAEAVYKMALDSKGINTKDVHPSAFKSMVQLLLAQAENADRRDPMRAKPAMDSKSAADFAARFPSAGNVKVL